MKPTRRSPQGNRAMQEFRDRWQFGSCWLCGLRGRTMHPHHIVYRRGKQFDDARNLAAVCWECHDRIHGATIVRDGRRLQPIPLADVLRAKRMWDPGAWDLAFLRELDGRLNYGEE